MILGIRRQILVKECILTNYISVLISDRFPVFVFFDFVITAGNTARQKVTAALREVQIFVDQELLRSVGIIGPGECCLGVRRIVEILRDRIRKHRRRQYVIHDIGHDREIIVEAFPIREIYCVFKQFP